MITTIILTKNNEKTILSTIESIKELGPVLIGDMGSNDKTINICENAGAEVYRVNFNYDFSEIKNNLIKKSKTEWILCLDPGEIVDSGHEFLSAEKSDEMYRLMILRDDSLTKQTRLFKKSNRFKRRVFEILDRDVAKQTLPIMITGEVNQDFQMITECLFRWKDEDPLSAVPVYYEAMLQLMANNYDQFLCIADKFLFQNNTHDEDTTLIKYYVAYLCKKKDPGKSLRLILECLASFPLMAEFWCLLGDLYLYSMKEYDRAYQFYENAIILGSQRLEEDTMPMEISKYQEYPEKMISGIKKVISSTLNNKDSLNVK